MFWGDKHSQENFSILLKLLQLVLGRSCFPFPINFSSVFNFFYQSLQSWNNGGQVTAAMSVYLCGEMSASITCRSNAFLITDIHGPHKGLI